MAGRRFASEIQEIDGAAIRLHAALTAAATPDAAGLRCNCPESGTSGSCPFHDSHSALAAPAPPAGLDVERLARAADAVAERYGWLPMDATEWGIPENAYWDAIATAYAAAGEGEG